MYLSWARKEAIRGQSMKNEPIGDDWWRKEVCFDGGEYKLVSPFYLYTQKSRQAISKSGAVCVFLQRKGKTHYDSQISIYVFFFPCTNLHCSKGIQLILFRLRPWLLLQCWKNPTHIIISPLYIVISR